MCLQKVVKGLQPEMISLDHIALKCAKTLEKLTPIMEIQEKSMKP